MAQTVFDDDYNRPDEVLDVSADWEETESGGGNAQVVGNILKANSNVGGGQGYRVVTHVGVVDKKVRYKLKTSGFPYVAVCILNRNNFLGFRSPTSQEINAYKRIGGTYSQVSSTYNHGSAIPVDSVIEAIYEKGYLSVLLNSIEVITPTYVGEYIIQPNHGVVPHSQIVNQWIDDYHAETISTDTLINLDPPNFTEIDTASRIDPSSIHHVDWDVVRNQDAYKYKDYGVGGINGDFSIECTALLDSINSLGLVYFGTVSNYVGTITQHDSANAPRISFGFYGNGGTYKILINEHDGSSAVTTLSALTALTDTFYYFTLRKAGAVGANGTVYLDIYDDISKTTPLETITVALRVGNNIDWRNFYVVNGINTGASDIARGFSEAYVLTSGSSSPTAKTASDALSLSLSETASIFTSLIKNDMLNLSLADAINQISVALASADTLSAALTELVDNQVTLTRSDNLAIAVGEAINIFSTLTSADGLNLSITEAISLVKAILATDNLSTSITEGLSVIDAVLQGTDVLDMAFADVAQTVFATLARSDDLNVTLNEFVAIFSAISKADNLNISIVDVAKLVKSIQANDTLNISLSESVPVITIALQLVDTLGVSLTEAVVTLLSLLTHDDVLSFSLTDINQLLAILARADTAGLSFADMADVQVFIAALDDLSLSLTDAATKALIDAVLGKLSAKIRVYPKLSGSLKVN